MNTKCKDDRPHMFLDLDQTLISSEIYKDIDFKHEKNKMSKFHYENMDNYYIIFARPNLQEFLDYLFANFNVSVWTAATKDYALFIIDKFILQGKKNRKLDLILFSYHCDISKDKKRGSKSLGLLWENPVFPADYKKENTFILDDNPEVYKRQKGNCIVAKEFYYTDRGSYKDKFLLNIIPKLEKLKSS